MAVLAGVLAFGFSSSAQDADTRRLFEEAQQARARGDYTAAESSYRELIRKAPLLAAAHHNLGIVYFLQGRYLDAASALEKALKCDPTLAEAHVMLGLSRYKLHQPDKAVDSFLSALRSNSGDLNARLYLGKAQIQMHDYRAAASTFERLAEVKPQDPEILYNLGLCYLKLGTQTVLRLADVAPDSYLFALLRAQDAEARHFDEGAVRHYREALVQVGTRKIEGVHYKLGCALERLGKYDEAEKEFEAELRINPDDALALWRLGERVMRRDQLQARRLLERAVGLNPTLPHALLAYGRLLLQADETAGAVPYLEKVTQLAPEEHSVHYHLFRAYSALGRDREAKAALDRFRDLARRKSEREQRLAEQLIQRGGSTAQQTEEPQPGFSPSREPSHH